MRTMVRRPGGRWIHIRPCPRSTGAANGRKTHPHLRYFCNLAARSRSLSAESSLPFRLKAWWARKKEKHFFFLKYEKLKPCIMGSKEKKAAAVDGYCWERVNTSFTGAVRHCPHADRSLQTCVDTAVCSQRDLYAC